MKPRAPVRETVRSRVARCAVALVLLSIPVACGGASTDELTSARGEGHCNPRPHTYVLPPNVVPSREPDLPALDAAAGLLIENAGSYAYVLDVSDPSDLRLRGELDMSELEQLTPLEPRRAVALRRGEPRGAADQLVLYGFDDPDAPTELARISIAAEVALLASQRSADPTLLYVLADEIASCTPPQKRSMLLRLRVANDRFTPLERIDLGDDLVAAAVRGNQLVLLEGSAERRADKPASFAPSMRVVRLDGALPPQRSEPAAAPYSGWIRGAEVRPYMKLQVATDSLLLVGQDGDAGLRFVRYDLRDAGAPRVLSNCIRADMADAFFEAWSVGERVYVISSGVSAFHVLELNAACETVREISSSGMLDVPDKPWAFEIGAFDELEWRLRTDHAPQPTAVARIEPEGTRAGSWVERILTDVLGSAGGAPDEPHLLGVSHEVGAGGELFLFSFSERSITPRGVLPTRDRLRWFARDAVITSYGVVHSYSFGNEAAGGDLLDTLEIPYREPRRD